MSYNRYRLVKPTDMVSRSSSSSCFSVSRPSSSNTSNMRSIIESSNRLDELLKQCRQLGGSQSSSTSSAIPSTSSIQPPRPPVVVSAKSASSITKVHPSSTSFAPPPPLTRSQSRYKVSNVTGVIAKRTSVTIPTSHTIKKKPTDRYFVMNHSSTQHHQFNRHSFVTRSKLVNTSKSLSSSQQQRSSYYSTHQSCNENIKTLDINTLLNRRVSDVSRNKFKFISSQSVKSKQIRRQAAAQQRQLTLRLVNGLSGSPRRRLTLNTKFKLARQSVTPTTTTNINSSKYKLENRPLFNKLNTLLIASNLLVRSKMTVNRVVKKDAVAMVVTDKKQSVSTASTHRVNNKNKKYCMYYNRFGRCSRGTACPYVHDPKRVAVCTRFLRGTCRIDSCPYSHQAGSDKIPVCSFFIAGQCNRENCPYMHTYLGKDATFCVEFAKGFCPHGAKCDKLHLYECPEYMKSGECPRGQACPLVHRSKKAKKTTPDKRVVGDASSSAISNSSKGSGELGSSFIHLNSGEEQCVDSPTTTSTTAGQVVKENKVEIIISSNSPIKIRPTFGAKKK